VVIIILILGLILGFILHNKVNFIRLNNKLIIYSIYLLLLLLGISVGSNKVIINSLPTLGWTAFLLTISGLAGSLFSAWIIYKFFFKDYEK